jgi:uncharacterized tellurite resistance protein B-like protein
LKKIEQDASGRLYLFETNEGATTMMDLVIPPRDQAIYAIRAMKSVALADGELHPQERRMLELALELFELELDVDAIETIEPEALAEGLTDPDARHNFVSRLVVLTTLDGEVTPDEVELVERYAAALGVEERAVKNLRQLSEGHVRAMMFDLGRRSFMPKLIKGVWQDQGLRGLWTIAKAAAGIEDAEQAARFAALAELPEHTLGYALYHQFADNGFAYPGQKHGPPAAMLFHDVGHVLAGYGTSPREELLVCAFQCGYMGDDGLVMYLMIAMLFQLAIEPIAKLRGVPAHRELVDVDTFMTAYERGKAMRSTLVGWDPWPHVERPLAEVRAELGVAPAA